MVDVSAPSLSQALLQSVVDRIEATGARLSTYPTRQIKRHRSTKAEVRARRNALYNFVQAMAPMTVRQVFYQATVHGLVDKSESGYGMVQSDLVLLRRSGELPYGWLADNTRWQRKPTTYTNVETALREAAHYYRKDLWADADCYVEIWLEKDALAGVIEPITRAYDVPLMVARLREMAPDAEIHFERIAINSSQITAFDLPTRPTKKSDSRSKGFGDISVELDAMAPGLLRGFVEEAIKRHLPDARYEELRLAEDHDRRRIADLVASITVAT